MNAAILWVPILLVFAWAGWRGSGLHCRVFGCERPHGKYCGICGRRQPDAMPQRGGPSTYKDAEPGHHHPRCHTIQYGSNESHCDCGLVPKRGIEG